MTEIPEGLTPANQNPWYVLMTLYGEQEGEEVDGALHARNRAAWNGWASSGLTRDERKKWDRWEQEGWKGWSSEYLRVQEEHKRQMQARNGAGFVYPGFPEPSQQVDMSNLIFARALVAQGMLFPVDTVFENAKFNGLVEFGSATFRREVSFDTAKFGEKTEFSDARFGESALFARAMFGGVAAFTLATFCADAQFHEATFGKYVNFRGVTFKEFARFRAVNFQTNASFSEVTFSGRATFIGALFMDNAMFTGSKFNQFVYFSGARFGINGERRWAVFLNCHFEKPTSFGETIFFSTYPDFSGAEMHDQTTFTPDPDNWPKGVLPDPAAAKASCAVIRHTLGRQGLPEAEHFFYRRELGFAGQIGGWWQRLPYRAFGALSDYGYSIARPALWLLGLWVAVAMVNHVVLQWGASMGTVAGYHPAQAFGLSFANLFPIFGLHKLWFAPEYLTALNGWLKFLGGVQAVLSLPLLFFLGLGLRTRFRLR